MDRERRPGRERRLRKIDEAIRGPGGGQRDAIAAALRVSAKTIQRDLEHLRKALGVRLVYRGSTRSWFYEVEGFRLAGPGISTADLFAIHLARQALVPYRNTPVYERVKTSLDRITRAIVPQADAVLLKNADHFVERIQFRGWAPTRIAPDVWDAVADGVAHRKTLALSYRSWKDSRATKRIVNPYGLFHERGEWYAHGWDQDKQAYRLFALSRMASARVTGAEYHPDAEYDLDKFLPEGGGLIPAKTALTVRLRFHGREVISLIENRDWYPDQQMRTTPDGSLDLMFKTRDSWDLFRWVLSWGSAVEAFEPGDLRDRVRAEAKLVLKELI